MSSRSVRFRLLILSEQDLPEPLAETHRNAKREIRDQLASVIAEGIQSGVFRPQDERVAAYAIVGMCNWTAWWFRPSPEHPVEPVARQIADMALHSVQWSDETREPERGPEAMFSRIREDLAALERMTGGRRIES